MNKKSIIGIIVLFLIVIGISLVLLGPKYSENSGDITVSESNLTLKYNNDYSSSLYFQMDTGKSGSAYYDKKTLNGSIVLDLEKLSWDENYTPAESAKSDANYAKRHFIEDITKDLRTLTKEINITYFDENNTEVEVVDYSQEQDPISNNMTIESNKLKIDLFKDYQKDYEMEINDGSKEKTPITASNATKLNTIKSAKIEIKLYNEEYCYHINIDVPSDKFNVTHF